jgi:hypothetical protein
MVNAKKLFLEIGSIFFVKETSKIKDVKISNAAMDKII